MIPLRPHCKLWHSCSSRVALNGRTQTRLILGCSGMRWMAWKEGDNRDNCAIVYAAKFPWPQLGVAQN